jgi:tight adherence protein B
MSFAIAVFIASLIFLATQIIGRMVFREETAIRRRLSAIADKEESLRKKNLDKSLDKKNRNFSAFFSGGKILKTLSDELSLAAIPLRSEEFILIWIIVTVAPASLVAVFRFNLFVCTALILMGALLAPILLQQAKRKRMALFNSQLSDSLSIMGNCLKAGFSLHQSIESIAREMPDPVSKEFSRTLREIQLGVAMEKALGNMAERIKNDDLELIVSAILIQRQTGGNLSEILETISNTIKERIKIKKDVRVLTANARTSGLIVGMLPVFILGLLMLINPEYVSLFFTTRAGITMLIIAVILETIGFLIVKKIVSVKF